MACEIIQVDPQSPDPSAIAKAARILQSGGLVAFPTETVYGLGASALNAGAVAKIFVAKGRPAINPIIVHVASVDDAKALVRDWPNRAAQMAARFWPGPLTLILPKNDRVPDIVTAGGPTVALRMPAHPVALALLRACGLPLAAPSANRSTKLSPTLAEHVARSLADEIDLLLDAGPTTGGLESTVLDLTSDPPRILRPGLVPAAQIEATIGALAHTNPSGSEPIRSPGQMARHYAPTTRLWVTRDARPQVLEMHAEGLRVGWLTHIEEGETGAMRIILPSDSAGYASGLYAALHQLDAAELDCIVVEMPPEGDEWRAVHDRLRRAGAVS